MMRLKNSSSQTRERLQTLIHPFLSENKFTHIYISWGSLVSNSKTTPAEFSNPAGDFIFDLASLTKVLVSAPLIWKLLKETGVPLESTLGGLIRGDHQSGPISKLSLISLIRHKSRLPAWRNFWVNRLNPQFHLNDLDRAKRKKLIEERILSTHSSGNIFLKEGKSVYSDLGYLLLGTLIENYYDKDLSKVFSEFCSEDLKLATPPLFFPAGSARKHGTFVPTSYCKIREKTLVGEVHDENSASLGGQCGHAGVFASGRGLVEYLQAYFQNPMFEDYWNMNQKLYEETYFGEYLLGWQKDMFPFPEKPEKGEPVFKHLGFTGTGIWIFPEKKTYIVILTNRVVSSRVSDWIQKFRSDVCRILWEDLSSLELVENT